MEGRTPIPAPATPPGGGLLEFGPQLSSGAKIRTSLHLHCLYFPFPAAWSTFLLNSLVSFFRLYVWSCGFFLSFFWVFGSLLSWVFASLREWRMPLPQCSRPALKSRELGFSLSVWQHITFVSPVLGAVGNSGFSRGATLSTPSSTTYTLPYNVRSTL